MKIHKSIFILFFTLTVCLFPNKNAYPGADDIGETDTASMQLYSFFDLRDRETFVQITNTDNNPSGQILHIQIFNVDNNCNENNFYDSYTPNDTHIYNMRDILTNDGNPSGVVLPDNAYGIVVVTVVLGVGENSVNNPVLVGNFRVIDNEGYEYRTNLQGVQGDEFQPDMVSTFNFSADGQVTLSDIVGIALDDTGDFFVEVVASDVVNVNMSLNVDIYNVNEVQFSCRNVIFSCVDQDNPRIEEILESVQDANVVSFEYGINNVIPHSRGDELLCPGNNITEGIVRFNCWNINSDIFIGYVGLNNGNGRASMDAFWTQSSVSPIQLRN